MASDLALNLMEQSMRSIVLAVTLGTMLVAFGSAAVRAQALVGSTSTVPSGPIGHLQPRAQQLAPGSTAEQVEQDKMSIFDAEQQKEDEELDKRLNICRGC
jgi:hypothetical protein